DAGDRFKFFIVLGSARSSLGDTLPPNVFFVQQPFGPKKVCQAAEKVKELFASQPESEYFGETPLETPPVSKEPAPQEETITIPETPVELVPQTPVELVCPNPSENVDAESKDQLHVLIVDDNDINVKILATFMRKLGYSYETASNGLIALQNVESSTRRYDLILMDLSMPVMDGLMSTSKIRQHEKDNGLKPSCIMAITGVASDTMREAARTAGVDDYLVKPLSLRKLKTLIGILF
ncbi:hypothetical protein LTR66_017517, partial [Elasticomyces elasticus]